MPNSIAWNVQKTIAEKNDPSIADRFTSQRFNTALSALGFSEMRSRRLVSGTNEEFRQFGAERTAFVAEAVRDSIKLSELQQIMPGLTGDDLVEMPISDIVVPSGDFWGYEEQWEGLRRAMVSDSLDVWVPNYDTWGQAGQPMPIFEALNQAGLGLNRPDRDKTLPVALVLQADILGYRDDALVTYYVSEEAAQADGLSEGEYHRAGYAASVPLMVAGEGKLIALRDVWAMPDLRRSISPESAFDLNLSNEIKSLGTVYLRERMAVKNEIRTALNQLEQWVANPKLIANESPDLLWGQVQAFLGVYELAERHPHLADGSFGRIEPVFMRDDQGKWRLRPLDEIDNVFYQCLAESAERLGVGEKDKNLDILLDAKWLWRRINAEQKAENQVEMPVETSTSEENDFKQRVDSSDQRKHVDVGEKIGGARKDFYQRFMTPSDLLEMNDLEIKTHVHKQNIWPPLDYVAMKEQGVSAEVAMAVKLIKDSINTSPAKNKYNYNYDARDYAEKYVEVVGRTRDIFSEVRTKEDLRKAVEEFTEYAGDGDKYVIYDGMKWELLGAKTSTLVHGDVLRAAINKIHKVTMKWDSESRSYKYDDPWKALIKPGKKTNESDLEERRQRADLDRRLHVPHLESVKRYGEDWRGGQDVTAEKLLEDFGFRAVEYGEWLPQKERQAVINMAYDSFADLANALGLEPKNMSLDGRLAVAFGSRGRGGKGAALAHFEPERFVINLTRMNGAGSMAHEWFHAFDRMVAMETRIGTFATRDCPRALGSLANLVEKMNWRSATKDEMMDHAKMQSALSKSNAESWLTFIHSEKRPQALARLAELLESGSEKISRKTKIEFDQKQWDIAGSISDTGVLDAVDLKWMAADVTREISENWPGLTKKAKEHLTGNVWHHFRNESLGLSLRQLEERGMEVPAHLAQHHTLRKATQFYKDAKELDKLRSSPYWATDLEMFARAGAAYVQDKIESLGNRSDYLVYGADNNRKVDGIGASPNPCGDDRTALNACFDQLMADYKAALERRAARTESLQP